MNHLSIEEMKEQLDLQFYLDETSTTASPEASQGNNSAFAAVGQTSQ
jgi:hypothetical protein